jgi:hypothetical protein
MSLTQLLSRDCTVIQRSPSGGSDDYGNIVPTETELDTVCELQQRRRDEPSDQGELSDTVWDAFFLPTEDVRTDDALVVDGGLYEFVGDPWTVRNPRTAADSHIEATARRAGGFPEGS